MIDGIWDVSMKTPIGTLTAVYSFRTEASGLIVGTARSGAEVVPLTDVVVDGDRVTWRQAITRPMRLNLEFEVTVAGATMTGHSRAGRLPRTAVSGTRS